MAVAHNWEPVNEGDPETRPGLEDAGIFIAGDVVLCGDCSWIGLAHRGACRKCASESVSPLQPIVHRAAEEEAAKTIAGQAWLEAWGEVELACGGLMYG